MWRKDSQHFMLNYQPAKDPNRGRHVSTRLEKGVRYVVHSIAVADVRED